MIAEVMDSYKTVERKKNVLSLFSVGTLLASIVGKWHVRKTD